MIIKDIEDSSEDENADISGFVDESKKRVFDENSDNDEEMSKPTPKKKWPSDAQSTKSSMRSGIHRTLSVKSGHSNSSKMSVQTNSRPTKKGHGDKKKPGELEPYAYKAFDRHMLNRKRKVGKKNSQFRGIVKVKKAGHKTKVKRL